jgi:hypothetical protein
MKGRAAVTLSNENGLSRFRACPGPRPTSSGPQRGAPTAGRQPTLPLPSSSRSIQLDLGECDGLGELAQARPPLPGLLAAG